MNEAVQAQKSGGMSRYDRVSLLTVGDVGEHPA